MVLPVVDADGLENNDVDKINFWRQCGNGKRQCVKQAHGLPGGAKETFEPVQVHGGPAVLVDLNRTSCRDDLLEALAEEPLHDLLVGGRDLERNLENLLQLLDAGLLTSIGQSLGHEGFVERQQIGNIRQIAQGPDHAEDLPHIGARQSLDIVDDDEQARFSLREKLMKTLPRFMDGELAIPEHHPGDLGPRAHCRRDRIEGGHALHAFRPVRDRVSQFPHLLFTPA